MAENALNVIQLLFDHTWATSSDFEQAMDPVLEQGIPVVEKRVVQILGAVDGHTHIKSRIRQLQVVETQAMIRQASLNLFDSAEVLDVRVGYLLCRGLSW